VTDHLKRLLAELVAIDSTSTLSNAPMIELLEQRLRAQGFDCQRQRYRDEAGIEKINLIGVRGARGADKPELALVGHSDCVPFDPEWEEALRLEERDGRLYGRGACDTKAFIAAALLAISQVRSRRALMAVFTADEELGCFGAKQLADAGLGQARQAIVGEPTSLTPIRGNKGYCLAEVEIVGKEGHSAYPASGASAIFRAARFIRRIELAQADLRSETDASFDPPYTTFNVGTIAGGKAKNIIAGSCRFPVEWRPIPKQSMERGLNLLEQICRELRADDPGFEARIRLVRTDPGADSPPDSAVVRFLVEQSGKPASTVAFGTEAGQMAALGAETVVFGPGNIQTAHRTGEFVPIDELVRAEQILERAIAHFCE